MSAKVVKRIDGMELVVNDETNELRFGGPGSTTNFAQVRIGPRGPTSALYLTRDDVRAIRDRCNDMLEGRNYP